MTASTTTSGDWRHHAACRDVDPELFHPTASRGTVLEQQVSAAKAVCAGCPVRERCLSFAMAELPYGIAGGLISDERHAARVAEARPIRRRPVVLIRRRGQAARASTTEGVHS